MHKIYVPGPHRFSKAEYHQMHDLGFFIDQPVELIDGEIVDMPTPGHEHCVASDKVLDLFKEVFANEPVWVRHEMPLDLSPHSEPIPDLSVVDGPLASHTATPTGALLVIEISDTTLADDQGRKASLYATSGIQDYWIVNLVDRQLEVLRRPVPDAAEPFGYRYADVTVVSPSDQMSPLTRPAAMVTVSELLP